MAFMDANGSASGIPFGQFAVTQAVGTQNG
jgi:hypothetical protein